MTSFGWKRKLGQKISKEKALKFSSESKEDDDEEDDWLSLAPTKKALLIEDRNSKSERLKKEGITLAEAERFWEAINKWNEAIQLTRDNETLMEMKAQALMSVGEVLPAVQAAQKTVEIACLWWVGHQTLGRTLTNIGEVSMALKSFERAIHLNPGERELWNEDLSWTQSLIAGKNAASNMSITSSVKNTLSIQELKDEVKSCQEIEKTDIKFDQLVPYANVMDADSSEDEDSIEASLVKIPDNYVHMREMT